MSIIKDYENSRGQLVGWLDDKGIYHSTRDFERGQIFHNPKYESAIGLDVSILKSLIRMKAKEISIVIKNFEKQDFTIISTIQNFIQNSIRIRFDKRNKEGQNVTGYSEQRILPLKFFARKYADQTELPKIIEMIKK